MTEKPYCDECVHYTPDEGREPAQGLCRYQGVVMGCMQMSTVCGCFRSNKPTPKEQTRLEEEDEE